MAKIIGIALRLEKWECFPKVQIWGKAFYTLGTAWAKRHENCPHQAWPKRVRYFLILGLEAQNCMGAFRQVQEARAEQRRWAEVPGESDQVEQVLCRPSLDFTGETGKAWDTRHTAETQGGEGSEDPSLLHHGSFLVIPPLCPEPALNVQQFFITNISVVFKKKKKHVKISC